MNRARIILAMAVSYFLFAILLNSVGTVILQSIHSFGITKAQAATLEAFKDLPIAIVSFLVASVIPRVGFKIALTAVLAGVALICSITPMVAEFWILKLVFACVGAAFAVVKVSVYALVGQVTEGSNQHSSLLNFIEGVFMLGVLGGYWIFAAFIDSGDNSLGWLNVYFVLAVLSAFTAFIVWVSPIAKPEPTQATESSVSAFMAMLKLVAKPLVLVFVISAFLYVLIEQSIGTWLPTFNNEILSLPVNISVQITSVFAACLALGRLGAGIVLTKVHWYVVLNVCLAAMAGLVILTLPMTEGIEKTLISSLFDAPLVAFLMPLIGLFMAPIYPVINSVMLSSLPTTQHASMTGLIVVFSALGGSTGSMITGLVFQHFGGQQAFYGALIPMLVIAVCLYFFKSMSESSQSNHAHTPSQQKVS
ncbi:MFS transporter [Pseudoalteromonas sp. OANN1]|uniref:MFS transporter n=1 Tax=Pseudoalteromonas sp. OANN1 TaxID=2954497 RepID=UPI0020970854|nr:MFS transporter [Pseudoalteromonas sp. OANN1]MCO7198697.1 MFS transporter [Pseudoalteromonas sp. OANN1]